MEKKEVTIVPYTNEICLFCGEKIERRWDECDSYFECECEDAKKNREISKKIHELELSRPKHKFTIQQQNILYKNENL